MHRSAVLGFSGESSPNVVCKLPATYLRFGSRPNENTLPSTSQTDNVYRMLPSERVIYPALPRTRICVMTFRN
ncbi:hypothetical protein PsYK624_125580 [Phanerochaete sordida]|uniref:Uncharacterized protein n=1 Tax=Phanerochaete sordida TaxID=48140 RepID=A0A9P3GI45_9APHY|nr:hypothetical protein PsYK624_125580 [Phanerochaete sordida]